MIYLSNDDVGADDEEFVWLGELGIVQTPKLELFATDIHFPTEDPAVFKLLKDVAKEFKPDLLWLNGDIIDAKSVSRFRVAPEEKLNLGNDLKYARNKLRELREILPNADIYFKEGNHDRRVQNFVWDHAEELSSIEDLELPSLLKLKDLNIKYVDPATRSRVGELYHLHGDEVKTGQAFPARSMLSKLNENVIFGHVHRFSVAYTNSLGGSTHVAWSIGCIQQLNVDYDFNPQWTQGFALIEYTKSGLFHINPIEVFREGKKAHCLVAGRLFTA